MTQHKPHDTLKADLEALAKVFEARIEKTAARRRSAVVTASPSPIRGLRDGGAAPRG